MMGSPFYYDVLFDDGPGDVVFHDCMWSGICTCCMQLLHQDSYYQFANESPDLKVEDLNCRTQQVAATNGVATTSPAVLAATSQPSNNGNIIDTATSRTSLQQHQQTSPSSPSNVNSSSTLSPTKPILRHNNNNINDLDRKRRDQLLLNQHHHQDSISYHHQQQHQFAANESSDLKVEDLNGCGRTVTSLHNHHQHHQSVSASLAVSVATTTTSQLTPNASNRTSPDNTNSSSSSSSTSSSLSPNSTSPKPIRRREHNDSERKRRDHLRNAFNHLRDQVPRFKAINKKPPRIQILHEATKYVLTIMRDAEDLEKRLQDERAKHERLKSL